MGRSKTLRKRRKRRQENAKLKFGPTAAPRHHLRAGRTGAVHAKKTKPSESP